MIASRRKALASAFALLAVLLAAAAAPYLVPDDPDSAVFRSGALAALLVVFAYIPVREAYAKAGRRTLACGLCWGLLFSCALSLGAELLAYDGLLPGLGSALRRAAVPVMATPLLGGLCALLLRAHPAAERLVRLPAWAYAAVIALCWLPAWLAYFPGLLNYDFLGEYRQHLYDAYTTLHPLLHSVLMNGVIAFGAKLGSPTFGFFLYTAIQLAATALSLGYACAFCARRGAPAPLLVALTAFFALMPIFPIMALSATKDTLFADACLVLALETYAFLEAPERFGRLRRVLYAVVAVGVALLRNNGAFFLALALPAMVAAAGKGRRLNALKLASGAVCTSLLTLAALVALLHPDSMPARQLYSLPAQQLVRAYNVGEMTDEEREELEGWYPSELALELLPHLADRAKGYLDFEGEGRSGASFLSLWARVGRNNPRVYAEALLLLNIGSWYPDDQSHARIYSEASSVDLGYLQTINVALDDEHGIKIYDLFPAARWFYERVCTRNRYLKYPVVSLLFCPALPFWALALAAAALVERRRARMLPAALGAFGLWLSYLLGPCTLPRYMLPLFMIGPVLLIAALCARGKERPDA